MTARSIPTLPTIASGQKSRASYFTQIEAWLQFWANRPMFKMYQTVVQSIANGTDTQFTMDSIAAGYDSDSGRGVATPWSYTIPFGLGARWRFTVVTSWAANATGLRAAQLRVNGAIPNSDAYVAIPPVSGNLTSVLVSTTVPVNGGDVITAYGYQSSGAALNTVGSAGLGSYFEGSIESLGNP